MTKHRITMVALVIAALLGGTFIAPPAPAKAAPLCSELGCNDKDPVRSGCFNPSTVQILADIYTGSDSIHVQIRYSPECQTKWARVYTGDLVNRSLSIALVPNGYSRGWLCYPSCSVY